MDSLGQHIVAQLFFSTIHFLIIRSIILHGKNSIFYWLITGLYISTIVWLVIEYIKMPKTENGGFGFAIEMYSLIIPGILTLISIIVFCISQAVRKN